jgi:hypothetical protein
MADSAKNVRRKLASIKRKALLTQDEIDRIEAIMAKTEADNTITRSAYHKFVILLTEYFRFDEIWLIVDAAKKSGL